MDRITLLGILFMIIYAFKNDRKNEKYKASENFESCVDDEWFVSETWEPVPESPFSIELSSDKNHPIMQGVEAFSKN